VRLVILCCALFAGACRGDAPQAPTSAEAEQLDEAESMLNSLAKEEGPEAEAPDPSNRSN
jgi:hypothetical protein